jgi:hypothetical protein
MTDPDTDELLSRVLDDEATPEERAQVQADPALQTRLQQLQAARGVLAGPVAPLLPDVVDQLVARALDPAPDVAAPPAPVIPLHRRRAVRAALSAAAVLLVVALAVPVLRNLGTGTGTDTASDQASTSDDSTGSAAAELAGPTVDDEGSLGDLGAFDDLHAVAAALAGAPAAEGAADAPDALNGEAEEDTAAATAPTTTAPGDGGGADFDEQPDSGGRVVGPSDDPVAVCRLRLPTLEPPLTGRATAATLQWQGQAAVAFLVQVPGSTDHVVVLSATTCEALAGPSPV